MRAPRLRLAPLWLWEVCRRWAVDEGRSVVPRCGCPLCARVSAVGEACGLPITGGSRRPLPAPHTRRACVEGERGASLRAARGR